MSKKMWHSLSAMLVVSVMILTACGPAPTPVATQPPATQAPATEAPATEMPATQAPAATEAPATSGKVEVFSWWVGPGEADGLAAMVKIFQAKYPNIEFVNAAVAGGAGTNAKAVLATRLQGGDPPDSWQAHAGEANDGSGSGDHAAELGGGSAGAEKRRRRRGHPRRHPGGDSHY